MADVITTPSRLQTRLLVITDDVDQDVRIAGRAEEAEPAVAPQPDHDQVRNRLSGDPVEIGRHRPRGTVRPDGRIAGRGCAGDGDVDDHGFGRRRRRYRRHTAAPGNLDRNRLAWEERAPQRTVPRIDDARGREPDEGAARRCDGSVTEPAAHVGDEIRATGRIEQVDAARGTDLDDDAVRQRLARGGTEV